MRKVLGLVERIVTQLSKPDRMPAFKKKINYGISLIAGIWFGLNLGQRNETIYHKYLKDIVPETNLLQNVLPQRKFEREDRPEHLWTYQERQYMAQMMDALEQESLEPQQGNELLVVQKYDQVK